MNRCGGVRSGPSLKSTGAQRLWEARVGAGLRLRDIAAALSVMPQVYSDLEQGRNNDEALLARAQAEITWMAAR